MEQIKITLSKLKVPQLKNIARYYNLHKRIAFSKLKKKELIDALFEHINYEPALHVEKIEKPKKEKKPKLQRQLSAGTAENLQQLEEQRKILEQRTAELMKRKQGVAREINEMEILKRQKRDMETRQLQARLAELESQLFS